MTTRWEEEECRLKPVIVAVVFCLVLLATAVHAAPVLAVKYVGEINGAKAFATITYEKVFDYVVMAGRIQSGQYVYTFKADIVGTAGYGDLLDHSTQSRLRIHIQHTNDGFVLTANPFGPGAPSKYYFKKT